MGDHTEGTVRCGRGLSYRGIVNVNSMHEAEAHHQQNEQRRGAFLPREPVELEPGLHKGRTINSLPKLDVSDEPM